MTKLSVAGEDAGAQHTPGPWEWQTPMGEHCPWIVPGGLEAYQWEPIATLGDCTEDGPSPRSKAFREIQANARLIAAAPDMLAAIESFMPKGIAIGNGNVPDDLCIPMDVTMGELRAFEAVIAKARGVPTDPATLARSAGQ